jgi:hypothetical protein
MTTFFVLSFVVLPLAIALVVLLFRGRGFIFNVVFVLVFVLTLWGLYQASIYLFTSSIEATPTHTPASVGPCLDWSPSFSRENRDERCAL